MNKLHLEIEDFQPKHAEVLEKLNLIRFIHHPNSDIRASLETNFYKGTDFIADKHGFHSVTITYNDIFLAYHPPDQNEIVFLWDTEENSKPLYFVIALFKHEEYVSRLKKGKVKPDDYLALRFPFNHPKYSSFIVWNGTVHCEVTDLSNPGTLFPSFFVLEPSQLGVNYTNEKENGIQLVLKR